MPTFTTYSVMLLLIELSKIRNISDIKTKSPWKYIKYFGFCHSHLENPLDHVIALEKNQLTNFLELFRIKQIQELLARWVHLDMSLKMMYFETSLHYLVKRLCKYNYKIVTLSGNIWKERLTITQTSSMCGEPTPSTYYTRASIQCLVGV